MGRPRKRWIVTEKDCLKKRVWMSGKQVEWCMIGVYDGDLCGGMHGALGWDEPLTLKRCHSCDLPQLYKALEGRKSVCG